MSAKKVIDTKIPQDENTDSGFLSGPVSEQLSHSEELDSIAESDRKNVSEETYQPPDSGLDLSEQLQDVHISSVTAQHPPKITVVEEHNQDIPPLAILFQQDDDGDAQLHIAAVHGCQKSIGTLINVCPDKEWLDLRNDFGHTPLHLAVMSGHPVVARMLVIAGAQIEMRDLSGETPLHKAAALCNVECIRALLSPVPEHGSRKLSTVLNQKNYNGQTCVHLAAAAGHIQTLKSLVYYGADINIREGLAGWTALHIAARRGDTRLAQYLTEQCPGVQVRARDFSGRTPRRLAMRTHARALANLPPDSDSESDSAEDMSDSDNESLFEKLKESINPINVA